MPSSSQCPPPPPLPRRRASASLSRDAGVKDISRKVIRMLEGLGHPALDEADDEHEVAQALAADPRRPPGKQRSTPHNKITADPLVSIGAFLVPTSASGRDLPTYPTTSTRISRDKPAAGAGRFAPLNVQDAARVPCFAPSLRKGWVERALDACATGELHHPFGREQQAARRSCRGAVYVREWDVREHESDIAFARREARRLALRFFVSFFNSRTLVSVSSI
ncbi:hypothetical protein FB451DRAFT_1183298 [Mycena latifolia]|nr:hypothetical protein FB451DRAFT_1183298 [Mycena latifolia]